MSSLPSTRCSTPSSEIGGDHVKVTGLTKPGVEPHDLELTARAVARVATADAVVYLRGFQTAVDEAVDSQAKGRGFDVTASAHLDLAAAPDPHEGQSPGQHPSRASASDPHFWLDPQRYAAVADAIAAHAEQQRPRERRGLPTRAKAFTARLSTLDAEFRTRDSSDCRSQRPGHRPRGLRLPRRALRPAPGGDHRADPRRRSRARRHWPAIAATSSRRQGVTHRSTPRPWSAATVAETVARETGARLAVLDPLEGLTDAVRGPRLPRGDARQPRDPARRPGVPVTRRQHPLGGRSPVIELQRRVLRLRRRGRRARRRPRPSPRARWSRCSAPTARASPRSSGASSA